MLWEITKLCPLAVDMTGMLPCSCRAVPAALQLCSAFAVRACTPRPAPAAFPAVPPGVRERQAPRGFGACARAAPTHPPRERPPGEGMHAMVLDFRSPSLFSCFLLCFF